MTLGSCDVYQPLAFAILQVKNLPSSSLDNIDNPYIALDISLNIIHHCTRNTCQSLHQVTFLNGWIITCLEVYSRPPLGTEQARMSSKWLLERRGTKWLIFSSELLRGASLTWLADITMWGPGPPTIWLADVIMWGPGPSIIWLGDPILGLFWHQWELSITSIRRPR